MRRFWLWLWRCWGFSAGFICLLFLVAAFSLLVVDDDHGGCIRMLVMAFLISPFGLPLLADFALDSLSGACGSLWGYIRAL